jgi:LemA protein
MKGFLIGLGIMVAIVAVIGLMIFGWVAGTFNTLVRLDQLTNTLWSQVETQYQRRLDLIPNLADSVKGYMVHEQKVFDDIAQARTHYAGAVKQDDKVQAQGALEGALARLMVIMENYPNIKADQTVRGLMDELAGTENRVNVARQRFNEGVLEYNIYIKRFPSNILAGWFNYREKALFKSEQGAEKAPRINLEVGK